MFVGICEPYTVDKDIYIIIYIYIYILIYNYIYTHINIYYYYIIIFGTALPSMDEHVEDPEPFRVHVWSQPSLSWALNALL